MQDKPASLYTRLGGYDAIAAVVDDLLPRLRGDELLSRFWTSPRSLDTHNRERQLAVDFIAAAAGGPTLLATGYRRLNSRDRFVVHHFYPSRRGFWVEYTQHVGSWD